MTIISVGSFWAVNHVGVCFFCHVLAQIEMTMMNEMILSCCYTLLLIASIFFSFTKLSSH